jgi:ribosomal protein S18 acetylase RimI-like enzyme
LARILTGTQASHDAVICGNLLIWRSGSPEHGCQSDVQAELGKRRANAAVAVPSWIVQVHPTGWAGRGREPESTDDMVPTTRGGRNNPLSVGDKVNGPIRLLSRLFGAANHGRRDVARGRELAVEEAVLHDVPMPDLVTYRSSVRDIEAEALEGGFFEGWPTRPSSGQHLALLGQSAHVALALDAGRVVGFATALSDGVLSAYIPLLEVLPDYRKQGIGSELIRVLLGAVDGLYMVDVTCDEAVFPFYERLGFRRACGAVMRNYSWRSPR